MKKSLRKQLMTWLLPLYVVAAIAAAIVTYYVFGSMVSVFMDNQLRLFAESHAGASGSAPVLRPLTRYNVVDKGDMFVQIWDRNQRLVATSWPELDLQRQPSQGFHDVTIGDSRWRVYTLQSPDRTVQSAQSLYFRRHLAKSQALQMALPVLLMIPISAIFLWFGMRPAVRRLELISRAAAQQDEHRLTELPVEHAPCEIKPLVMAVNTLLARLRNAFSAQRRFVQDAAHELRTPITAMSLQLENLKSRMPDTASADQLKQLEAGLARTKRLVEQLLRLARQESPRPADPPVAIQLDGMLKSSIAEFMALADKRSIDLGYAADIDATVHANEDELRSLIHNLLDNALRYTPTGGIVDVTLHRDTGVVTVEIADNGTGIPAELLPRVFDRFFRIEGAETEGSGLGLAIAKNAAERNRVALELINRVDGSGLIARMRFETALVTLQPAPKPAAVEHEEPSAASELAAETQPPD
ncbi:sensor histidine kinase [Steroidobacter cummioxidans]|uniref:sensor histidine kinase n=1 Tax=Steroidobacter cummioxidans TaxID=1803913 RepID=UPI000E313DDE|nr:ATP-binding protein [Steroidobacter cummioxidans]